MNVDTRGHPNEKRVVAGWRMVYDSRGRARQSAVLRSGQPLNFIPPAALLLCCCASCQLSTSISPRSPIPLTFSQTTCIPPQFKFRRVVNSAALALPVHLEIEDRGIRDRE